MSLSRTALMVCLERSEIEELIDRIQENMYQAADKQEYADAASCKRRITELREILKTPAPGPE